MVHIVVHVDFKLLIPFHNRLSHAGRKISSDIWSYGSRQATWCAELDTSSAQEFAARENRRRSWSVECETDHDALDRERCPTGLSQQVMPSWMKLSRNWTAYRDAWSSWENFKFHKHFRLHLSSKLESRLRRELEILA